ncbi:MULTISPECIES: hypothetical protein [Erwinia]|uniref:hypothetical protein n=1 Tax=Erwinia TaxID=551 RepID=UPI00105D4018|nr:MULTISPECIES: hypothetical protein [Erwinia]NNS05808.1 hypothetical protein [Erwinia sp. JH02]TDS98315.1 hypothetical protein EDF84_1062 [Erwinia rhapontici]
MEIDIGSFTRVEENTVYAEVTIYTDPNSGGENVSLYLKLPYQVDTTLAELEKLARSEAIKQMRAAADWLAENSA